MNKPNNHSKSTDAYISAQPDDVQVILRKIRELIRSLVPEATETISYGIPTFDLHGKHLVHFAGFQNHVSFFPTSSGVAAFADELKAYKISKGTIQFALDKPVPYDLITKITKFRIAEVTAAVKH